MRITGGQWRGRRLGAAPGRAMRPTTDRVREALFNLIGDEVADRTVADCCCGTGSLGLEALSRGARRVEFVDVSPEALRAVRANLDRCEVDPSRWALHRADAARWLAKALREAAADLVVLADPPYGGPVLAAVVGALAGAPPPAVAVIEHASQQDLPPVLADGWLVDTRIYGNSALTVLRPRPTRSAEVQDE